MSVSLKAILTNYRFAASLAMMMTNSSLESPKPYLFARYLSKSVAALLSHVILFQKILFS